MTKVTIVSLLSCFFCSFVILVYFDARKQMKAVATISVLLLLFSCNSDQYDQCKKENDQLKAEKIHQDSILSGISIAYHEIDSTSKVIDLKKSMINELALKKNLSQKDKEIILAQMDTINFLLDQNKTRVSGLEGNLDSGSEDGFKHMVKSMNEKNTAEDDGLIEMKNELAQISIDFHELFEEYVYKEAENMEIQEQLSSTTKELEEAKEKLGEAKEKLYSAWYIIGEEEELKEKGLVHKKGFFDNKEINDNFDKSHFKKINIYELKEILLDAKKVDILTTHPSESYERVEIKKQVNKLVITNPDLFWSVSKVLIIEIEH